MGSLALLPPLVAIVLALLTKEVFGALLAGIAVGALIMENGSPFGMFSSTLNHLVGVFSDPGNVRVLIFCSFMGSLLALIQRSGGVQGFVTWAGDRGFAKGPRSAWLLTYVVGLVVFIESNITCLVTGSVGRPLFDKFKLSREKLALVCDSTCAPICMMIPLNAWGALVIGLLTTQGVSEPVSVLMQAIPLSLYLFAAPGVVLVAMLIGRDFPSLRRAEERVRLEGRLYREGARPLVSDDIASLEPPPGLQGSPLRMLLPIGAMVVMIPAGLWITGGGDMAKGSGSTSVLWGVTVGLLVAVALSIRPLGARPVIELVIKGIAALVPLNVILVLAYALGTVCTEMGTGRYMAQVFSSAIPEFLIPAAVFLIAAGVAFSTGTSWGTFAILMPVAVGTATSLDLSLPLMVSAVLSGGVFGDHASILSDTTIVASMASNCDLFDHFSTQLPYALTALALTVVWYLGAGILF